MAYRLRTASLRDLIAIYDTEVATFEREIRSRLRGHDGYRVIQQINGIGPAMAAILVAELVIYPGSAPPKRCARGPDSHPHIASPIPKSIAAA